MNIYLHNTIMPTKKSLPNVLILSLFFIVLAFLNYNPTKPQTEINDLVSQFDLKLVTETLDKSFCERYQSKNVQTSYKQCLDFFHLAVDIYYNTDNKIQLLLLLTNTVLQDASRYIDQLAAGSIPVSTEEEKVFLKQYNPWLLEVANIHVLHNLLSPLNFNLTALLKSMVLSSSYSNYLLQLFILFACILYLKRFYSLPEVFFSITSNQL